MFLDQMVFECWSERKCEFSATSHVQEVKDKFLNKLATFIAAVSLIYCNGDNEWTLINDFVSDGAKVKINDDYYDNCNDPGYMKNYKGYSSDYESGDDCECNERDFDSERDDSDDSNYI